LKVWSKKYFGKFAVCAAMAFGISLSSIGSVLAEAPDEDAVLLQIVKVAYGMDSKGVIRWFNTTGADRHYIYIDNELRAQLDISRTEFDTSTMFVPKGASIEVFARVPGVASSPATRERK